MTFWLLAAAWLSSVSQAQQASRCEAAFSMPGLVSAIGAGKLNHGELDSRELTSYYVFKSLGAGSDSPCDALKALSFKGPDGKTWRENCRGVYYELAFSRALAVDDPKTAPLCEGALNTDKDFISLGPKQIKEACGWKRKPIPDFCRRLAALFPGKEAERKRLCLRYLGSLVLGESKECADSTDKEDITRCGQYVLFHEARASKDLEHCADGEICLAFMGKGAQVSERYAERLKNAVCAAHPALFH